MKKLLDKTGAELFASLVNIAAPIGNLVKDEKLFTALSDSVKNWTAGTLQHNNLAFVMNLYSGVVPTLFCADHVKDVMLILAEIEGTNVNEMLQMNGADLINDVIKAWKEQIGPFAERSGLMALMKSRLP